MLPRRIREEWNGKSFDDFYCFITSYYPLSDYNFGGSGQLYFNTGLSVNQMENGMEIQARNDIVISTGLYVDDDNIVRDHVGDIYEDED